MPEVTLVIAGRFASLSAALFGGCPQRLNCLKACLFNISRHKLVGTTERRSLSETANRYIHRQFGRCALHPLPRCYRGLV